MPDDFKIDIESLDIDKFQAWDLTEFNEQIDYVFNYSYSQFAVDIVDNYIVECHDPVDISDTEYHALIEEAQYFIDERLDRDYTQHYLDTTYVNVRLVWYSNYEYLQPAYREDDMHDPETYLRQILQQLNIDVEKKSFEESWVTWAWFMHEIDTAWYQWHFIFTGKVCLSTFINDWEKIIYIPEWTHYWIYNWFVWASSEFSSKTVKDFNLIINKSFDSQFDRWEFDLDNDTPKQYDYSMQSIFDDDYMFNTIFTIVKI